MGTIRKIGKSWWVDYRLGEKRVRKRIGRSKRIAELALADIEVKIAKHRAGFATLDKKLSDYIPQFLSYIEAHSKPLTTTRYRQITKHLSVFLDTLEDPPIKLSQISPAIIEEYKLHRLNLVKPQTVNTEIILLHHFFRYAVEMEFIGINPTQNIKKIKNPKRKAPRFLSREEITKILSQASPRLKDIVPFLLNTGLRWGELQFLEWSDVDWREKRINIRIKEEWSPKGGERKVPINEAAIHILRDLPRRSRWVFTTKTGKQVRQQGTWTAFKLACRKVGIEDATLHTLRHTFASHLVMAGVDLATISKLLGHKDISTTMIYSHLSPDHLRQAVKRLEF